LGRRKGQGLRCQPSLDIGRLYKDGCKDKEDKKKKTEEKKGDSSVGAKVSPQKKRMSDGHFASQNSCHVDSASDDECSFILRKMRRKVPPKMLKNYYQREREAMESIASRSVQKALKPIEKESKEVNGILNRILRVVARAWMWFLSHFHLL
jgi:hypothetical protein